MNEQAIKDAYDLFVSNGYTKSIEEFKQLMGSNPTARKDAFDLFVSNGYSKQQSDFDILMGVQSQEGLDLKKKEESPNQNQNLAQSLPWLRQQNQPPKEEPLSPFLASISSKPSSESARPIDFTEGIQKWKAKEYVAPDKIDQHIARLSQDIVDLDEGDAVNKLKYLFGDLGFSFEEAGIGHDAIKVISPTGKTTELDWDTFTSGGDKLVLDQLQNFLRSESKQKANEKNIENFYKKENEKFYNQQEVDDKIKSLSNKETEINNFVKRYSIEGAALQKEIEKLNNYPESGRDALYESRKADVQNKINALETERKKYLSEAQDYEQTKSSLSQAVGKYIENQETLGSTARALGHSYLSGVGRNIAGGTELFMDLIAFPFMKYAGGGVTEMPDYKQRFASAAKEMGLKETDPDKVKSKYGEDIVSDVNDKAFDSLKKEIKYGIGTIDMARKAPLSSYGSDAVSQEYINKFTEGFWGGAFYGTLSSIPAMMGGTSAGRTLKMMAQMNDFTSELMSNSPELSKLSENEKLAIKAPIAITSAVLEEFGLRNVIANKGLLNGFIMRALGKAGANVTAKSFAELVRQDVKSALARGALTTAGGALAEFETGALQELSEKGIEQIYNKIKGKEMFKNLPNSTLDYVGDMLYAGAQEAVGGFTLGIPGGIAAAYRKQGFEGMSDNEFHAFELLANNDKIESAFVTDLKAKVNAGDISLEDAKTQLNDYRNSRSIYQQIPDDLSTENKKKAMNLIRERNQLTQSIEGKDPSMTVSKRNRINEINNTLEQLSTQKQNAVQEPSTEEGVLRPEESQMGLQEMGKGNTQEQAVTEETVKETESKIKRKDLFDGVGSFSRELGGSPVDAVPVSHSEKNGIEFVQYANPNTGSIDVIVTGTSNNDYVGYYRIYENGKPTEKWSSKFENQSRNKENFKTMISGVQALLPEGHEYTEKTSISTDGLRVWGQQLDQGYEMQYDDNGNIITNDVAINGDAIVNELGVDVQPGQFNNIEVKTNEDFNKVKNALLPYLNKFGLNENNIRWENGTVRIDLPVLRKKSTAVTEEVKTPEEQQALAQEASDLESLLSGKPPVAPIVEVAPVSTETKAAIERRRQEELKRFEGRRANSVVKFNPNGENTELTEKEVEEVENLINTAKEKGLSVDRTQRLLQTNGFVQSVSNTPTAFREFLSARLSGEIDSKVNGKFLDVINAKYDAELAALEQTPTPTPVPVVKTTKEPKPTFLQTMKEKIRDLATPKMGLQVNITPATVRTVGKGNDSTKRIVELTNKYNSLYEKFTQTQSETEQEQIASELEDIQSQILDGARKEIIERVAKIKGVSVRFDDSFIGSWDGNYEPSFNMKLFISPSADVKAINEMLYDIAEKYSQDAFIVSTVDSSSKKTIKEGGSLNLPLTKDVSNISQLSPVITLDFKNPLSLPTMKQLFVALREAGINYSLNRNMLSVGFYPYLNEEQRKLPLSEQEKLKKEIYLKEREAYEQAIESVFGERPTYGDKGTKPNTQFTTDLSIKKSSYISARNSGSTQSTRVYDRSNILEEYKKEIGPLNNVRKYFGELRNKQINGKKLTEEENQWLKDVADTLHPLLVSTFDSAKGLYLEAKKEIESIADKSIKGMNAFISTFPIKRPSRAAIKTLNWYGAAPEKLGDGARVNILVENDADANTVFDKINEDNPKNNDKDLRRINDKTELGYPKRLLEVRTSNGVIAEMQVMTINGYLAKDGINSFPENKKSQTQKALNKLQQILGFKIPDGLGHYFYEINRDTNVPNDLRKEASRLSNLYYDAFLNTDKSTLSNPKEAAKFMNDLLAFKNKVDNASKLEWDKGNEGKAPDSIKGLNSKSVLEYTPSKTKLEKTEPLKKETVKTVDELRKEYKEKINKVKEDKKLSPSKKEEAINNLKAEFSALKNRIESQAKSKVEAVQPKGETVNVEYSVDVDSPIHQSNMDLLAKTIKANKVKPQAEPMITIIKGKVIVEYNNFDAKNTAAKFIFNQDANGKWSAEGIRFEPKAIPIRETVFFQNYINPQFRTEDVVTAQQVEDVPSNMVLTGNEEVVKGENMPTVALGNKGFNDDYSFDDMMNKTYTRTSADVTLAEDIANGEMEIVEKDKDKNKIKRKLKLPYINKVAAKKIAKLKNAIASIKDTNDASIKEKNKKTRELNKIVKTVLDDFRNVMAQNILALYDSLTEDFVSRSKDWYVGANRMANNIAKAYNITLEQMSGIIAVLSPQQDWFNNVSMAERTVEVLSKHSDTIVSQEIFDKAMEVNSKNKNSQFTPLLQVAYNKYGNISINGMQALGATLDEQSLYLRAIDQALYSNKVVITSPSGKYLGIDTVPVRWASSAMISSAISIYRDGASSNINLNLGNGNKVRNFYNNIADPNSKTPYVTADTHALSVAMNMPISAKVATDFGIFGGGNNPLYSLVKTAYIDAANIAGILPREMQSVTWEAQRTGVNDKNRTVEQKNKNFSLVEELRQNEQTPYERATTIISRNRSKDPAWGQSDRVVTQRTGNAISRELESRANERASNVSSIRGQQPSTRGRNSPVDNAIAKGQTNSTEELATQYVGNDLPKIFQLIGRLQQAFPNVIVSVDSETFNNILSSPGVRTFVSDGVVIYGVTINGDIYINPDVHKSESDLFNTSIHEFGHIWQDFLSTTEEGQKILDKGYSLIKEAVGVDPYITNLYNEQLKKFNGDETKALNEVTSILIGNKGAEVVNKSISERIKDWLSDVWNYISSAFKMSSELTEQDVQNMTLDQFIGTALADMLSGKQIEMNDSQLKQLKNPEAAFSSSQNIFDIITTGRQNGFSDASIKAVLLNRGFKAKEIDAVMQINLNLFDKLPPQFANVEGGVNVGMDLFNQTLNKLIEFQKAYAYKSMADIRQKALELLQANPIFKNQTDQIQKELMVALDKTLNTKANKDVNAMMAAIKNDLKQRQIGANNLLDSQIKLRTLIRNLLPKSNQYTQSDINKLIKLVNETTVDNFRAQSEVVFDIIEKQQDKIRKNILAQIFKLVTSKAKTAKTTTGKRRSKGLDAQGQLFFEAAKQVLKAVYNNDAAALADIASELSDTEAIDNLILKSFNDEQLTTQEQRLLDKATAFDSFSDLMNMDIDQLNDVLNSLKEERAASIVRLKESRQARALMYKAIIDEADNEVANNHPLLFTEVTDEEGNTKLEAKTQGELDADKDEIWHYFNKLKLWDATKKFAERWSYDSLPKIFGFFRSTVANIEFFTNLYDKTGKYFKENIYDKLNKMNEEFNKGYFKEMDHLDMLANSIDGINKGYKQIRKMLEIGIHEFQLNKRLSRLNGDQLLRIYALYKNDVQREKLQRMGFGQQEMQRINDLIPEQAREFADKVVQYFSTSYYESVNSIYSSLNDVNLQYVPNYFPTITESKSVGAQELLDGNFNGIFNAENAPSLKERSDTESDIDILKDFTSVLESHFQTMEKYKAYAAGVKQLNALFQSRGFNNLMQETGTKGLFKNLINQTINPNGGMKIPSSVLDKLYTKYSGFALAYKLIQLPKQLTAFIFAYQNYQFLKDKKIPGLDAIMFMLDNAKVIATLPSQFKKAKEISATFRDRVAKGIEGDVFGLESGSSTYKKTSEKNTLMGRFFRGFKNVGAAPTIAGDLLSVMSYMAVYNRNIANGMSPEQALLEFNNFNATLQTRRGTEKSTLQTSQSVATRAFTMFGSTAFLQLNGAAIASQNIARDISNKKVPSQTDIRRFVISFGLANFLFVLVSNIGKLINGDDDDEEEVERALQDALLGLNLIYQIPIIGSGVEQMVSKARGERKPIEGMVNPIGSVMRKVNKGLESGDWIDGVRPIMEIGIGAQLDPLIALYSGAADGFDENTVYDLMGISQSYRPKPETKSEKKEQAQQEKELEELTDISMFGMTRAELKKQNPDMYKLYFTEEEDIYGKKKAVLNPGMY